jgi:hypothetical protein
MQCLIVEKKKKLNRGEIFSDFPVKEKLDVEITQTMSEIEETKYGKFVASSSQPNIFM